MDGTCTFGGCGNRLRVKSLGLCSGHYQQIRRGEALRPMRPRGPNAVVIEGVTAWLILTNARGREIARTAVDVDDLPLVRQHRWCASRSRDHLYAWCDGGGYLHRFLLGEEHEEVDHEDGDPLNNRRSNLRPATRALNAQNVAQQGREDMRGVKFNKMASRANPWQAHLHVGDRYIYGGLHPTREAAQEAAAQLRAEHFEYANEARHAGCQPCS